MRSIKPLAHFTALLLGCVLVLSGCSGNGQNSDTAQASASDTSAFTTSYTYAPEDTNSEWSADITATAVFSGGTAQVTGAGAAFADGTLTISQAGTYVLSGTLTDGQILIDAGKDDLVRVVLNELSLHHADGPALYAPQSKKTVLILAAGTRNTLSDAAGYTDSASSDDPDAAVFVQDNLSITGSGSLTVTGQSKHGIRTQDVLAVTQGVLTVEATGDALRGRDGIAVQNGAFTLTAGGDGIQSNNDEEDAKGFVIIDGGAFAVQAKSDGIQAQSALTVSGGALQITTGGGSAAAPVQEENFRSSPGNRGTSPNSGNSNQNTQNTAADDTDSLKALKAGKLITITGGDITIDAEDDAVHSNDRVQISAGTLTLKTGDDGIHADSSLNISGGAIAIPTCYEGIEGLSVTISGGEISVVANDDALNAAGGADNASQAGGPMGKDQYAASGDIFVRISGGTLDLAAGCDGIDANGNLYFEGGSAKISGPSMGMEGAIDLDGKLTVSGGSFITAGSVLNVSEDSTQPVILISYSQQQASGSVIALKDSAGGTLLEYTSHTSFTLSGLTSSSMEQGETYSLYINGQKKTDIKLSGAVTSIGDDGGTYNGGRGGGRGNWGTPGSGGQNNQGGGRGGQ